MQRLATGMFNKEQGFSLIEILVVIVIISITVSFALLAFGDFGKSRRIAMAADQFANTLRMAQQQAIIESSTLGVFVNRLNYQVYRFYPPKQWRTIASKGIFKSQRFPENTVIHWSKKPESGNKPAIIINASGDMTPFRLRLGSQANQTIKIITARHDGLIRVLTPGAS